MIITTNLIERLFEESQDNPDDYRWQAALALEVQAKQIEELQAELRDANLHIKQLERSFDRALGLTPEARKGTV